jgi:hypothetical protein
MVSFFSSLYSVSCRSAMACTAIGGYDDSSGVAVPLAEAWNGTAWAVQATPSPRGGTNSVLAGVSCAAGACTAVGSHLNRAQVSVTLAEAGPG